ncbi:unnamed protein product [Hymenolepis diminuta]|uniref:PH domain-containing protein n=1 Tax=Hymenolepis diminuta TaxID=6216 RepID=A0A158QG06_HYMDI|nr:unnamed protein product [Hymenolepis diminuta]
MQCSSRTGCVDLNSCDCIYEQKVGNQLPNVFVVQTTYRDKRRDYLFSANTPEEMSEWITQLTKVLHMVPEQVSGPTPGEIIRRNGNSLSYFSSSRQVSTSQVPSYSKNSSHPFENSYVDRGLTEEYRTSFGEAPADDDDCYHILPQPDHAYVNLKGDGSAAADTSVVADSANFPNWHDRPDSVYFNVWDSSTVDFNAAEEKVEYHNAPVLAKSEKTSPKVPNSKPALQTSTTTTKNAAAKESPPTVNETQLPKRCRNTSSSSSSSDDSTEDEDTTVSSKDKGAKEADTSIPLDGAGEAEATASSPSGIIPPPSSISGEASIAKSTPDTTVESGIQYLDAENLDFSLRQRAANAAPLVPPKPVHLRRSTPKETNSEGASTNATTKPSNSNNEENSNPSGYSELDVRRTKALFMVTKKMFGEDDDTA